MQTCKPAKLRSEPRLGHRHLLHLALDDLLAPVDTFVLERFVADLPLQRCDPSLHAGHRLLIRGPAEPLCDRLEDVLGDEG